MKWFQFSSVQLLSRVWLFATPWVAARQASLSITNSWSSLKLTSIELMMPSSHLILCHPLFSCPQLLPASDSFPMSQLFAWGGQSMKWLSFFKKVILNYLLDNSHISVPLGSVIKGLLWSFDQVMFPWLFAYLEIVHCYFGTWRSCNRRIPYCLQVEDTFVGPT